MILVRIKKRIKIRRKVGVVINQRVHRQRQLLTKMKKSLRSTQMETITNQKQWLNKGERQIKEILAAAENKKGKSVFWRF